MTGLELYSGQKIDPANTLLIFDEVQEVPKALTSLKYFNENAPQYQIVCAGSLLGRRVASGNIVPRGQGGVFRLISSELHGVFNAMGHGQYVELLQKATSLW